LGQAYVAARLANGKPPAKLEDLDMQKEGPKLHKAIQEGQYVVIWGVAESSGDAVLAYEKEGSSVGRVVLMADGSTIKTMNEQEFEASPKAKGKP
jgi:hypothetical protein